MAIKFYHSGKEYDIFSNVTDVHFSMNINGQTYYPYSSEAVYQGLKAIDTKAGQDLIMDKKPPGAHLQKTGNKFQNPKFKNNAMWSRISRITVKEQLMYEILLAKFTQNPNLLKALLDSAPKKIVENTRICGFKPVDKFWGNGSNGKGRNALGKALMRVRSDLQKQLKRTGKIQVRQGLSNRLARRLGHTNHKRNSHLSKQFLTKRQLNQTRPATTVSRFKQLIGVAKPKTRNPPHTRTKMAKASNLLVKEAPQHKVLKKLRVKNKATQLTVAPDVNKPGDYVIKVTFKSKADAAAFMKKHHRSFQQAPYTENNGRTIVMGPKRANSVFKSLGAKKHNMFKDLVDQHKQASQKQAMTPRSR